MSNNKILVIGAGELGLSILRALSAHPSKPTISVLLRPSTSPERKTLVEQLESLNITLVYGDLASPIPALADLLAPYGTVISAAGFASGPGTQMHLARAALHAGVRWYFPWQFGVDYDIIGRGSSQPLFDEQLDVRDLLRGQSRTEWTIVSTGIFTSFLFDPAFGVVDMHKADKRAKVTALGGWGNGLTMTSVEDIGTATAKIACETNDKGVVYVSGDSVTLDEVAQAYERKGWEVEKGIVTVQALEQARRERPDDLGPKYGLIWARGKGVQWDKEGTYNHEHGLAFESMEKWMERNL